MSDVAAYPVLVCCQCREICALYGCLRRV